MRLLTTLILLMSGTVSGQDFSILSDLIAYKVEIDFGLEPPIEDMTLEPRTKTTVRYPSKAAPLYNLEGSWTDIHDIRKVRIHLNRVHSYDMNWLNQLTLNQLWHVHDTAHVSTRATDRGTTVRRSRIFCPT
jgi:hypothetical protein